MTENTDPRIAELHDTILATPPGHTATWISRGVEVTVYGQRRYELDIPTPWAQITVNGHHRAIRTWQQLLDLVDEAATATPE